MLTAFSENRVLKHIINIFYRECFYARENEMPPPCGHSHGPVSQMMTFETKLQEFTPEGEGNKGQVRGNM